MRQVIDERAYRFFHENGYVSLGKILTDEETARYRAQYDRDRTDFAYMWRLYGHQTINCDALISWPEVDELIRHPVALSAIETLMNGSVCFSEVCVRHMAVYEGETHRSWHRDRSHAAEHPLRMPYIQLMLYLSDVDETTHCFSVSPESADDPVLETDAQLARGGVVDLHGEAGTAILFNIAVLHTATVRPTRQERKTVQVYYGPQDARYLSNDSCIPTRLWRDHADPATRMFYGKLNPKSALFSDAFGIPATTG
ncbi:MAG: phytanoyl-CoA dioxygenase family protein [candidate division Zixibacteria bacterium]|nr:phytanoyl-CoA dioxygenase family protein [candidate division Zixibacteria bacterium]